MAADPDSKLHTPTEKCVFCGTEVPVHLAYCPKCGRDARYRGAPKHAGDQLAARDIPLVVLLIIFFVLTGLMLLVRGYLLWQATAGALVLGYEPSLSWALRALLGLAVLVSAIACFLTSYGLWQLRSWAPTVTRIVLIAFVPVAFALAASTSFSLSDSILVAVAALVAIAATVQLSRLNVKRLFK